MCGLADGGSIQAVLCQQVPCGAGAAEHILHAHAAHGGGQLLGQDGAHGFAQTADDVVLLGGDHLAALFGRLQDDLLVQRLDGVDVDDAGMDALGGQLLGSHTGVVKQPLIRPVAMMAMSLPSVICSPLPISKW